MHIKYILVNITFFVYLIKIVAVGSTYIDIVLPINESGNFYTRFINLTKDHFSWFSSVLCDNDTYQYGIVYNKDYGLVITNSSATFKEAGIIEPSIYLKEFTCTKSESSFDCARKLNTSEACQHNLTLIYLDVNLSTSCIDRCVSWCPLNPIQAIFIKQLEMLNNSIAECQSHNNDKSTILKSESTRLSTSETGISQISSSPALSEQSPITKDVKISTFSSTSSHSSSSGDITHFSDDYSLPVILGASVGGGICIIIVLIVIVVCIRKRRQHYHPRKSVTTENNLKFESDNALDNQLHHHNVYENDSKKDDSAVNKLEIEQRLIKKNNVIRSIVNCTNVNSNKLTYSGTGQDFVKNSIGDDYVLELNESNNGYSQNTFSNPVLRGLDADYSCTNEIQDKNKSGENVDEKATKQSRSNNPPENTYSTLGEQTRSYSETYNIMPLGMEGKEVNNARGDKHENNISFVRHKISEDNYSNENGAANDVYAQVNKTKIVTK